MLKHAIYYGLKPYLPQRLRMAIRRFAARRTRRRHEDAWPIDRFAAKPPPNWRGWPQGKRFAVVLTHDVEGPIGVARCAELMRLTDRAGFRSSFNFIPYGPYATPTALRRMMVQDGFEVGVHDWNHDGKLFTSRREFQRRAKGINRCFEEWGAVGFRAGCMFRNLDWMHHLAMAYDASTFDTDPMEPQPEGTRTIYPFFVPPPVTGPGEGYVELPYTVPQDFTLFALLQERTTTIWKQKIDWIAEQGGMILMDTHPDYMALGGAGSADEYPSAFYEEVLQYIRQAYAGAYWHALPAQVAAFVNANRGQAQSSTAVG